MNSDIEKIIIDALHEYGYKDIRHVEITPWIKDSQNIIDFMGKIIIRASK